jgi:hypothetical protein
VHDRFHFRHADGTRILPLGTTAYAWTNQGDDLEKQTLQTLADSPFHKIRMCVLPIPREVGMTASLGQGTGADHRAGQPIRQTLHGRDRRAEHEGRRTGMSSSEGSQRPLAQTTRSSFDLP